jgi:hypothetical protein
MFSLRFRAWTIREGEVGFARNGTARIFNFSEKSQTAGQWPQKLGVGGPGVNKGVLTREIALDFHMHKHS